LASTKIHPGFLLKGRGLTPAAIMSLFTDRIVKDDSEAIGIHELVALTADTRDNVMEALRFLADEGMLKIAEGTLESAGSIRIEGFAISIAVDQMTLPLEKPKANDIAVKPPREFEDEVDIGGRVYRGKVDPREDSDEVDLSIERVLSDDRQLSEGVFYGNFPNLERAWHYFDNFVQKDSRTETFEQTYTNLVGTKWEATFTRENSDDEEQPEYLLRIFRTHPGEATSTKVYEDSSFESATDAWKFVDEYLGPLESELATEPETEGVTA